MVGLSMNSVQTTECDGSLLLLATESSPTRLTLKASAFSFLLLMLTSCAGRSLLAPNNPLVSAGKTGIGSSLVDVSQFRA